MTASDPEPRSRPNAIVLRRATPDDESFLFDLYRRTAGQNVGTLPENGSNTPLVEMQYHLRNHQYRARFSDAADQIVVLDDVPVGRLLVDRAQQVWTIVDVAILPEFQNRGIGRRVLQRMLDDADRQGSTVRLHVLVHNPARRLYHQMGFRDAGTDGIHLAMERPGQR